ncbi:hypothetical protein D3C79_647790 [compost metagenome]
MPKSSMEMPSPSSARRLRMARLSSAFSMAVDSVISRVRWRASSRWRERAVSTSSSKPGLASCMVERFTATLQS